MSECRFPLLDLPAELVNRVLEFAVVSSSREKPIDITRTIWLLQMGVSILPQDVLYSPTESPLQPAITRTCRLLRVEGLKIFYGQNVFSALQDPFATPKMSSLCPWLRRIDATYKPLLNLFFEAGQVEVDGQGGYVCNCAKLGFHDFVTHEPINKAGVIKADGQTPLHSVGGTWCYQVEFREDSENLWEFVSACRETGTYPCKEASSHSIFKVVKAEA